jgi:hypothetical protein
MGWMLRHPHGPSRRAQARSGRLKVNRGFQGLQCPRSHHMDLLSGFERPSRALELACSLNFQCWYVERSGAGAGPIAQLARARA